MQQPGGARKCSRCSGSCERVKAHGCNRAGKSSCTEHSVWEPGSAVLWLTGCLARAGAHLSPFLKQLCGGVSVIVGRLLSWCPGCPSLSALLFRRVSQTTHLRLASLRCSSLPAQTRGDKLFPMCLIDKSSRTRRAHSQLQNCCGRKAVNYYCEKQSSK